MLVDLNTYLRVLIGLFAFGFILAGFYGDNFVKRGAAILVRLQKNSSAVTDKTIPQTVTTFKIIIKKEHSRSNGSVFVIPNAGRLGNQLFQYAGLFSLSKRYNLSPYYPKNVLRRSKLGQLFCKLSIQEKSIPKDYAKYQYIKEAGCCRYNKGFEKLKSGGNFKIFGFFISKEYIDFVRDEILQELKLCSKFENAAAKYLKNHAKSVPKFDEKQVLKVGIHIRRTDFAFKNLKTHGFIAGNVKFINTAIRYVQRKIPAGKIPIFFVCADDLNWAKQNLCNITEYIFFVDINNHDMGMDFAVLKNADIVILTAGISTFGWWAAYLNEHVQLVIYQTPVAKKGSKLDLETNVTELMPASWIPLHA